MPEQLTFDLPVKPALGRGDFFVSPSNTVAVATLEGWHGWPLGKMILCGPAGSGKTHLAHVWARESGARIVGIDSLPQMLTAPVADWCGVVLEDAHKIAGKQEQEETLFHLHNRLFAENVPFLLTARNPPGRWGLKLTDLKSRLEGTSLVRLEAPDDGLLSVLLVKLFLDRQITIAPGVVPYAVSRMGRSFADVQNLVTALDRQALREKSAITKRMVGQVLDKLAPEGA